MSELPSDDRGWFQLVLANQPPLWRLYAEAVGGEIVTEGDVQGTVVASSPNRSFFNSVFYEDPEHLIEMLPRLAETYEAAGVNAWTVWIPAEDERARGALSEAGHVLDATPRAMGFELSELSIPEADPELEIRSEMDMDSIRQINETAYGYAPGDFPPMEPLPETTAYLASLNGDTVGTALTWDRAPDTEVTFVATSPAGSSAMLWRPSGRRASWHRP
jgi:hypothetical protein